MKPISLKHLKNNTISIWVIVIIPIFTLWIYFVLPENGYFGSDTNPFLQRKIPVDPCLGRYIYIQKLPSRFNKDLLENCGKLRKNFDFCPYVENGGFGSPLKIEMGISEGSESWYDTHQSMLEVIFHTRMKEYECLTNNSSMASAIYAPFYPGLEAGRFLWGGFNGSVKDAGGVDFAKWLRGTKEWGRVFGWDHFFVSGRISWDFRRWPEAIDPRNWGTKLMTLEETRNTTMLTVESGPHYDNDFAIPYPIHFHPSNETEILKWQERVRNAERTHLFAFAGGPYYKNTTVRNDIITQCKTASGNRCKLLSYGFLTPDSILRTFMMSDFCLQPPGDSPTRRSIFDAILSGCIPVFFHPGSAYTQYFWHLPKNYTKYSVFIPPEGIKNGTVKVEDVLIKISRPRVIAMREEVIRIIPRILYALKKLETIQDAFDITIEGVLERIKEFRGLIEQGKDPRTRFSEQFSWKYYLTGNVQEHEWDRFFVDSD